MNITYHISVDCAKLNLILKVSLNSLLFPHEQVSSFHAMKYCLYVNEITITCSVWFTVHTSASHVTCPSQLCSLVGYLIALEEAVYKLTDSKSSPAERSHNSASITKNLVQRGVATECARRGRFLHCIPNHCLKLPDFFYENMNKLTMKFMEPNWAGKPRFGNIN